MTRAEARQSNERKNAEMFDKNLRKMCGFYFQLAVAWNEYTGARERKKR